MSKLKEYLGSIMDLKGGLTNLLIGLICTAFGAFLALYLTKADNPCCKVLIDQSLMQNLHAKAKERGSITLKEIDEIRSQVNGVDFCKVQPCFEQGELDSLMKMRVYLVELDTILIDQVLHNYGDTNSTKAKIVELTEVIRYILEMNHASGRDLEKVNATIERFK